MSYFNKSSENIDLAAARKEFGKLKGNIYNLLYALGDDGENLIYDRKNLDQEFIADQYKSLVNKLESVYDRLEYLSKPVKETGIIKHNDYGRYELPSGDYFTSGSSCEILITQYEQPYWVYTAIEHNGEDYYATVLGREFSIDGMKVRVRERY